MVIDFNCHIGQWPEHDVNLDAAGLLPLMNAAGIDLAVTSDVGTLVSKDNDDSLASLSDKRIIRFVNVRPETQLKGLDGSSVAGIRLYPVYHEWNLGGSSFDELLSHAGQANWIVQIYVRIRDPRLMPQRKESPEVIASLVEIVKRYPEINFVISGATLFEVEEKLSLFGTDNVWTETAHLQCPMNSLPKLMNVIDKERILFGSNTPFFYPYSGIFRIQHSPISENDKELILGQNAKSLLVGKT
jgi:hypothetical protein